MNVPQLGDAIWTRAVHPRPAVRAPNWSARAEPQHGAAAPPPPKGWPPLLIPATRFVSPARSSTSAARAGNLCLTCSSLTGLAAASKADGGGSDGCVVALGVVAFGAAAVPFTDAASVVATGCAIPPSCVTPASRSRCRSPTRPTNHAESRVLRELALQRLSSPGDGASLLVPRAC